MIKTASKGKDSFHFKELHLEQEGDKLVKSSCHGVEKKAGLFGCYFLYEPELYFWMNLRVAWIQLPE